jgi:MFS family permease
LCCILRAEKKLIGKKEAKITIWNINFTCVIIANFMHCLAHFSVNPLVASYMVHLGQGAVIMGLLTGMFFGVSLAMRPVAGPVTTKIDKRKLIILAFALGGVVNLGYALFHSVSMFVVFRFLTGVQYSLAGSLIMTIAGDNLPREKMASGMGIYGLGGAIGMALGPTIGINLLKFGTNIKNESAGYTLVFLFAAIVFSLAVIPSYTLKPDRKTKEDILSTGVWYKNIASVYAVPTTIVMFFLVAAYSLYNTYMVEFAKEQGIKGISSFYTVLAMVLIISRPMSGWLTDKFGVAKVLFPAMILYAVSFIIIGFSNSIGTILVGAVIAAIGYGSSQPALLSMCIQSVTPLKRSVASNTIYIGIDLGFFLGPLFGSLVYEMFNFSVMFKSGSVPVLIAVIYFIFMLPAYYRRRNELKATESGL